METLRRADTEKRLRGKAIEVCIVGVGLTWRDA